MKKKKKFVNMRTDSLTNGRLVEIDKLEKKLFALYKRGEISESILNFELDGLSVSRSIIG